jgi:hypothetical protein
LSASCQTMSHPNRRENQMRGLGKSILGVGLPTALLVVAGSVSLGLAATPAAWATSGTATITDPNTNLPLSSGGSTTVFTVDLPAQAACSKDTANNGYHVFSYLVTASTNISTLTFGTGAPSSGYGLADGSGYYGSANTAPTTGEVINIPNDFEWADTLNIGASAATLDGGSHATWEAGLACANPAGTLTDNWNTPVTFTKSTSDPHGFVWTAGVPKDTTKTTVKCAPKAGKIGKVDTCTATVADSTSKSTKPTGTVSWSGGTGAFGTPTCTLSAGKCTDTFTPSAKATDTLTGAYGGSASEAVSSGTAKLKVK